MVCICYNFSKKLSINLIFVPIKEKPGSIFFKVQSAYRILSSPLLISGQTQFIHMHEKLQ